jgi:hypothetical protein
MYKPAASIKGGAGPQYELIEMLQYIRMIPVRVNPSTKNFGDSSKVVATGVVGTLPLFSQALRIMTATPCIIKGHQLLRVQEIRIRDSDPRNGPTDHLFNEYSRWGHTGVASRFAYVFPPFLEGLLCLSYDRSRLGPGSRS